LPEFDFTHPIHITFSSVFYELETILIAAFLLRLENTLDGVLEIINSIHGVIFLNQTFYTNELILIAGLNPFGVYHNVVSVREFGSG